MDRIDALIRELESLPSGTLSRKTISGKRYWYLSFRQGSKVVSKYIPEIRVEKLREQLKRRKEIQEELKAFMEQGRSAATVTSSSLSWTGSVMHRDQVVATFERGELTYIDRSLAPLVIQRTQSLGAFLKSRVIDTSRTNARLLKKVLGIQGEEDWVIALKGHATSVTDDYWFRLPHSKLKWADVRLNTDVYHEIALEGRLTSIYLNKPRLSPQTSLLGSYEKCWRYIDGRWWMYKKGSRAELLSELIAARLSAALGIPTAEYELDGDIIKTPNFAVTTDFEPVSSLAGENDAFEHVINALSERGRSLVEQYLMLIWFDALVLNVDRHNENVGILRDKATGSIVSLAPNYDLNMSLFSRGPMTTSVKDGFIHLYWEFIHSSLLAQAYYYEMELPILDEDIIRDALKGIDPAEIPGNLVEVLMWRYEQIKNVFGR